MTSRKASYSFLWKASGASKTSADERRTAYLLTGRKGLFRPGERVPSSANIRKKAEGEKNACGALRGGRGAGRRKSRGKGYMEGKRSQGPGEKAGQGFRISENEGRERRTKQGFFRIKKALEDREHVWNGPPQRFPVRSQYFCLNCCSSQGILWPVSLWGCVFLTDCFLCNLRFFYGDDNFCDMVFLVTDINWGNDVLF